MTRVLAGPVSTRFLASLGAEVLRIDPPAWDEGTLAEVEEWHFSPDVEQTPWGTLRRLQLPYRIDGVNLQFDYPVSKLRSAQPRWMS